LSKAELALCVNPTGEYSMIVAAANNGWIDGDMAMIGSLIAL
jgi:delta-aminolevulinic acid dehydratase/porphobilinogen synthase